MKTNGITRIWNALAVGVAALVVCVGAVSARGAAGPGGGGVTVFGGDAENLAGDEFQAMCRDGGGGARMDNSCEFIESLELTCDLERSRLRAFVDSDLPPCTQLRLVADEAFYRNARVRGNGLARARWRNPVLGEHEVCIDGCDICATTVCGCACDAECDDGDLCTTDECIDYECVSTPIECDDGLFCNGEETCDPDTGECVAGDQPCADCEICNEAESACDPATAGFTWEKVDSPVSAAAPFLGVHGGLLYAFGGVLGGGACYSDAIWSYDPSTDQWTEMAGVLPYGAGGRSMPHVLGDTLYMSPQLGPCPNGGWGQHNKMIEYDFLSDTAAETVAYCGYGTIWIALITQGNDGTVYSIGGWTGSAVNKIFRYDDPMCLTELPQTLQPGAEPPCGCRDLDGNTVVFGYSVVDDSRLEIFDPENETIVYSDGIIPPDVQGAGICWTDANGSMFLAHSDNQVLYQFDSVTRTFTPREWVLPTPAPGATLASRSHAYDDESGRLYITERYWDAGAGAYETSLWIGTPSSCLQEKIVFSAQVEEGGQYDIFTSNPDETDVVNLTDDLDADAYAPAISPDGTRIAFLADPGAGGGTSNSGLWVMNADGGSKQRIWPGFVYAQVRWIDNERLAFGRWLSTCDSDIALVDIGGGPVTALVPSGFMGQRQMTHFDLSPDRSRIVFHAQVGCWSPTMDIYKANVACLLTNPANPDECGECLYTDLGDDNVDSTPLCLNDNQTVYFSHQVDPGVYAPMSLVRKAIDSPLECDEYDGVVREPAGPDECFAWFYQASSPDDSLFLHMEKPNCADPWNSYVWDSVNDTDTLFFGGKATGGADWGFLK